MKKILIATDGSPSARDAVAYGLDLAEEQRAEAIFVHVAPAVDLLPVTGFGLTGAIRHEVTSSDRACLDEAQAAADGRGVPAHAELLTGNTVDEVVAYADSIDADLIVVGSAGHGAIASAVLGSVSRGIVHEARRPVLIVRGVRRREPAAA